MWKVGVLGLFLSAVALAQEGCEYDGMMYKDGETFLDSDGCNNCFCSGGAVACTLKLCLSLDTCSYGGLDFNVGDSFNATDGCNTCTCQTGGMVACTEMACIQPDVPIPP